MTHYGQGSMNRETSIYSSDSLVVVDRSRNRRRMVIIGAIAALAQNYYEQLVRARWRASEN